MIETTQMALVARMLANPNDMEMFGVYADWLQENGEEELAEQVRLFNGCILNVPVIQFLTNRKLALPGALVPGVVSRLNIMQDYFIEHAATLFKTQPIRRVELTDVSPIENGNRFYVYVEHLGMVGHTCNIREELFSHMCKNAKGKHLRITDGLRFDRIEDYAQTISAGCINYGRTLAGLPPLTEFNHYA